jgi:hypothetical protein
LVLAVDQLLLPDTEYLILKELSARVLQLIKAPAVVIVDTSKE